MRLLSNNVHQNHISVFYNAEEKKYYKIASTPAAAANLKKEKQGWDWYSKNISKKKNFTNVLIERDSYYKLVIQEFQGTKADYQHAFENNFKLIEKVVDWYISNWPKEDSDTIHGDMTLDNIIFSPNQKIYLIDWECFTKTKVFWGYDIIYFILSAIFLPSKKILIPSKNELTFLGNLFLKLLDNGVPNIVLETPLASLHQIIDTIVLPNNTGISKNKFFPLWCSELERDIVDESLVRAYRYAAYDKYLKELEDV